MKKRTFLIVLIVLALAVASYQLTTPIRMKGVVRRLLRSPQLEVEVATKLVGGFEPTYAAIVVYDTAKAPEFCRSLNLYELHSEDRDRRLNLLKSMPKAFPGKFMDATNQHLQMYVGTLKHAPFATDAVIGNDRIYFIFSRY